ncbi:MAG: hypothetical protein WCE48_06530 [Steroidobacteraceae bacterium]
MRVRAAFLVAVGFPCTLLSSVVSGATAARDAAPARQLPQTASPITDRFALRASYLTARTTTGVRLDPGSGGTGTAFSAEDDLGLDQRVDQGRIELIFRLLERHRLRMDFFRLNRDGDRALTRALVFGDNSYLVNDRVQSRFNWQTLGFTYTYSVLRRDTLEAGLSVGLHLLQAEALGEVRARNLREENSVAGAFPTVGVDGTWRISRRFAATLRGQYFGATTDRVQGFAEDYHFDVQYRWRRNLAAGLGYTKLRTKLEGETGNQSFQGRFDLTDEGPEFFVRVSF